MDDTFPIRRPVGLLATALVTLAASGLPGCSNFHGTTAASFLKTIRENPDPNRRFVAYHKLASPMCYDTAEQKVEAVRTLIEKLESGDEPAATRAVICRTLGELGNPLAREVMLKRVNDPEGVVRVQACRALGHVGQPEDATVLLRVMTTDPLEDCRIAAIEGMGALEIRDSRVLGRLIDGMEDGDPAIRLASLEALRSISGKDFGVEPAPWRKFLQERIAVAKVKATNPDSKSTTTAKETPTATAKSASTPDAPRR